MMHHLRFGQRRQPLPTREDEKWQMRQQCGRSLSPSSSRRNRWARRRMIVLYVSLVVLVVWKLLAWHAVSDEATPTGSPNAESAIKIEPEAALESKPVESEPNGPRQPDEMEAIAIERTAEAPEEGSIKSTKSRSRMSVASKTASTATSATSSAAEEDLPPGERALLLPEFIHIPFEDAVAGESLEGWEDEWWSEVSYDTDKWGNMEEPKIDFVYLWVNGSDNRFVDSKKGFELSSPLNDEEGLWLKSHGVNRYRDWDELRYSIRSLEKYTGSWRNTVQLLVNTVQNQDGISEPQMPTWLNSDQITAEQVKVVPQEELFDEDKRQCLPTFNSLTIENQIFNINSSAEHLFALSDDMLLGKQHAASDFYSPLYGPTLGFKTNAYSTKSPPTDVDAKRFGEKPYLIYTSWLLNRRFGERKRKGQVHFGHSITRRVMKEAMASFPRAELESVCQRFRGEAKFQLYSWYVAFHYTIERHREVLLWSYILHRADPDQNENLSWDERQQIMADLEAGIKHETKSNFRQRNFYHLAQALEDAGLEAPKVNTDVQWTSLDGPLAIRDIECLEFDVDECLAPGFSSPTSDTTTRNPVFSTAAIFDRVARADPHCGDCLLKLLLNQQRKGFASLLPIADTQKSAREAVLKALKKYQYTVIEPDALFVMITDAEQVENTLLKRFSKNDKMVGQLCLNDDVTAESEDDLNDLRSVMHKLYTQLFPTKSKYEL